MIESIHGDILHADTEALVNPVNCVGVMGSGLALQFRRAFPETFRAYRDVCDRHELELGRVFVYDRRQSTNPRYIINFPTKGHWKAKSRIEDIESGLLALAEELRCRGIRSVAIPPLGCGLGGLDWNNVRPRIEMALHDLHDVTVWLYEPEGQTVPEAGP